MTDEFTHHFFKFCIAKVASGEFGTVSEMTGVKWSTSGS
jgi:hypothetical protein